MMRAVLPSSTASASKVRCICQQSRFVTDLLGQHCVKISHVKDTTLYNIWAVLLSALYCCGSASYDLDIFMFVSDSRQPPASHDLLKLFRMPIKKDGGDDDSSVLLHCVWWWKRDCENAAFLLLLVSGFVYLLAAIDVVVCSGIKSSFRLPLIQFRLNASEGTFCA